mgnify:CR=1 FL=1
MRVAVERFGIEPYQLHQSARIGKRRVACDAVVHRALDDRLADRTPRIERAIRILKNDLHPAAETAQRAGSELRHVLAVEHDPPRGRLDQPRDAARDRRLARARLADDAERFAASNFERHRRRRGNIGAAAQPSGPARRSWSAARCVERSARRLRSHAGAA